MGATVKTEEKNLNDGYIMMWFQFKNEDSDDYSAFTCTVKFIQEDDGFAALEEVKVTEYWLPEPDAWVNPTHTGNVHSWNEEYQVKNPLWVVVAEAD